MRAVAITPAEAIFEPLWDPGAVQLDERFPPRVLPPARGRVSMNWFCLSVALDHVSPNEEAAHIERTCDLEVEAYDLFRVQCRMPTWASITVDALVDGAWTRIVAPVFGTDATEEVDGRLKGRTVERYRLAFTLRENRPAVIQLWWLGVAKRSAEKALAARRPPYDSAWEGRLRPSARQAAPSLGLLFGAGELEEIKAKVRSGPLAAVMELLRAEARKAMEIDPESQIGEFAPFPWHMSPRKNRAGQKAFHREMRVLAFVGLVDGNDELSRMAVRMALSAAHCASWTDNIMGQMPGIPWHCRSFVEEVYCQGCALVLDWAGEWLTPFGAEVVRDAIVMKGLPRIESDFKRSEYIRSMNQGIVFSAGRVLGAMALVPAYPRYRKLLEEAESDLFEMIDAYVRLDGGTLEGPAYWNYTFSNALPTLWALARFRAKSFADYVPETVRRTGRYGLAMMSSEGEALWYLPVNDAHASQHYAQSLVAGYCRISEDPRWKSLYGALLSQAPGPDYHHLIMDPGPVGLPDRRKGAGTVVPRYDFLGDTGQLDFVRRSADHGWVQFHFCGGPTYGGHFDEDKGAFILEAAGEVLAMDRGCCDYAHPESLLIGNADRHNLLFPEGEGEVSRQPPGTGYGATLASFRDGDLLAAAAKLDEAWPKGLFMRNCRRIFTPAPELTWIEDDVQPSAPLAMSFLLHTAFPVSVEADRACIIGTKSRLWVVPVGWLPSVSCDVLGADSHLHPANVLRMTSPKAAKHRLRTLLLLARLDEPCPVTRHGDEVTAGGFTLTAKAEGDTTRLSFAGATAHGAFVFGPGGEVRRDDTARGEV